MKNILGLIIFGLCLLTVHCTTRTAECNLEADSATAVSQRENITGTVTFTQVDEGDTSIVLSLNGFDTTDGDAKHGFHIHETGDISGGCSSTGGHYNPYSVDHGSRSGSTSTRHVGDLGNIQEDGSGDVSLTITDSIVSLTGSYSVIDRAIVIHQTEDDLGTGGDAGSTSTGNAGGRLACCIITQTSAAGKSQVSILAAMFSIMSLIVIKI